MPKRDIFQLAYSVRMSAESSDTAEINLWGEIVNDLPQWYKENWPEDKSSMDFKKAIDEARANGATKLMMHINSPGGIVTESIAMRSILANAGFEEINIRIEGLCASAATNIATIPGAHVQIAEGSEYMIHNPWTYAWGFASDLEHTAERLRNMEATSRGFYCSRSGQDEEKVKEWMDKETWFTAEQAVEYGFCDELLKAEAGNAEPAAACVTPNVMMAMKGLYQYVPGNIRVVDDPMNASAVTRAEARTACAWDPLPASKMRTDPQTTEGNAQDKAALNQLVAAAKAVNEKSGGALSEAPGTVPCIEQTGLQGEDLPGTVPSAAAGTSANTPATGNTPTNNGMNISPVAGEVSANTKKEVSESMDIKDLTQEQLASENPALVNEIAQQAVAAERERVSGIDAVTMAGYEQDAAEAKENGTSVAEFIANVVAKQKAQGKNFMTARKEETAPAANVTAGAAEEATTEDDEIKQAAKAIAEEANKMAGGTNGMF